MSIKGRRSISAEPVSISCNLCGSFEAGVLSLKDRRRKYLRTVICKKCGLIWTDPRSSGADIRSFYSGKYRREYKGSARPKMKHIYRDAKEALRRHRFISEFINEKDRILDVGSGTGVFLYTLRRLGYDACGLEPDRYYGQYSRKEFGLPVKTAFLQDSAFFETFDFITMHHVLEHTEDPLAILKKIRELLKPAGFLYLGVPNAEDISQAPVNRYHQAHLYTFNPETITALSGKAGFTARQTSIKPHGGDIALLLQKSEDTAGGTGGIPGNYTRITRILKQNNCWRHFTTVFPYRKFAGNLARPLREKMLLGKYKNSRELLDAVIAGELGPA